ncbi:MAG: SHOCT domain-containing protein [Chloroflexota bacterium]
MNGFSLLLVGGAAYKIGQAQARQIQQHTGRPPEDLSPEELENAMDALNIETQELNANDKAAIEAEAVGAAPAAPAAPQMTNVPPPAAAPPPAQPAADVPAYIAELQQLAGLRDMGIITNDEFEAKKKQLLGL